MNLFWTIVGVVASLLGAGIAIWQASKAKSAAREAKRVKEQILDHRQTSELSKIQSNCRKAQNAMAKYGPASSINSLSGVDSEHDAKEVQDFLLLITEHRDYFKHRIKPNLWNEADSLCDKMHPMLNEFVDETEGKKLKISGTKILLELNQFSSTIKKLVDIQTSKTK